MLSIKDKKRMPSHTEGILLFLASFFSKFVPFRIVSLGLCSIAIGFTQAYGCAIIGGEGYFDEGYLPILPSAIVYSLATCLFLLFADMVYSYWRQRSSYTEQLARSSRLSHLVPEWRPRSILVVGAVVFLIWLPWGIALFPGSMNWDTFYQIISWDPDGHPLYFIPCAPTESFIDNAFSDHHPIFDTFIFGLFAKTSGYIFDTWNHGVFAFLVIQAFTLAVSLSTAIAYFRKHGAPLPLCFALLLFIALFPPLPIYAFTMLKDCFSCVFFIPWMLMFGAACLDPKNAFDSKRKIALFIILSILLCLSKKTGFYIALVGLIGITIFLRQHWKVFLSAIVSMVVVMQVILPFIVFPLFDVAPSGKQEMLGMVFQQTARYANVHATDVSPEEHETIDRVLGYNRLQSEYLPQITDPIKFGWNWRSTPEDLSAYYQVWIQQGLRHPLTYLEAPLAVNAKFFCSIGEIEADIYLADEEHGCWDTLHYPAALTDFRETMSSLYEDLLEMPLLNWLFKIVLYVFWLPIVFCYLVLAHERKFLPICIVLLISWFACFIGPVYQTRYAIAFIYTAPLLIGFITTQGDPHEMNGRTTSSVPSSTEIDAC